jgi:hypothetical protein
MMKISGLMVVASFVSVSAFAAKPVDCKEAAEDLRKMQNAQQSISESLISNHDSFADQMQEYALILSTDSAMGQPVAKESVQKMNGSAKSFRDRGENARKMNKKFAALSEDVIARAISCLKK